MPPVVGAVAASWATGATVGAISTYGAAAWGVGAAVAYGAGYVVGSVALTAGISSISRAVMKSPSIPSLRAQGLEVNVRDPAAPRQIIHGRRRVSGVLYPVGTSGTNNEYLHLILLLAGHECEELGDITFNDEVVPLDGSGNATGRYAGYVRVKKHLGAYNQTVDTDLQTDLGSSYWSNNHRLQGIAYLYIRLKVSADLFPGGIPEIYCKVKGRKLYDDRDVAQDPADAATWTWSNNAALCLVDWVRGVPYRNGSGTLVRNHGVGALDAEINYTDANAAANICEESVVLADTSTEDRYTCNGVMLTSILPGDGVELLKSAMAGDCVYVGGQWVILAGAYRTPTLSAFDEGDLRAPMSDVKLKPASTELFNVGRGIYVSADNNWQPTDLPQVPNSTYKTQDGGEDLPLDMEFPFTTSSATGQRLLKIAIERSRQGISFVAKCKLGAWQCRPGDVILWTDTDLGWSSKAFEVLGVALVVEEDANGQPYLGCDLTLRETASAVWDWSDGEETTVDPAPNTALRSPFDVAPPTSLSVTNSVQQQTDGTTIPRLQVSWTAPADANVTTRGNIRLEYKLAAASDWLPVDLIRGDITVAFITAVIIGQSYNVRIRSENDLNVASAWVTSGSTAVTGDTDAPGALAAPTVTAYPGYNAISWVKSVADDIAEYRIYRNTSNTTVGATLLGETDGLDWDDPTATPGVTYYYFIAPVDASENEGTKSPSGSVTTALAPVGATTPSDPTAASKTAEGTYLAGDGTVFSYLTISVPALPTNAVWQNLLYRRDGASDWLIGAQLKNSGSTSVRLDDLSPGVSYEVASQAWSGAGGSNIVTATSSPFTAPNKSSGPSAPSSITYVAGNASTYGRQPAYYTGAVAFATRINWTAPSDKDVAYYEWVVTGTDSDVFADAGSKFVTKETELIYSSTTLPALYFRVRAVDHTGNASAWGGGGTNLNTVMGYPAGNMSNQNASGVAITGGTATGITNIETTGITIGGGSSQRRVLAHQPIYATINVTGGAATETVNLSLSNYGFSTRPDAGVIQMADWDRLLVRYDIDDSTSTNAVLRLSMSDGTNLPALTGAEITGFFTEYD